MSFMDEYNALKKKRKQEEEEEEKQYSGDSSFLQEYKKLKEEREKDESTVGTLGGDDDIAPIRTSNEDKDEKRTWFQKSEYFDDGYQFGDIFKTILGSKVDIDTNVTAGVAGMGEKILDAAMWLAPAFNVGQQTQNNPYYSFDINEYRKEQGYAKEFIEKDLYDAEKVAKTIISDPVKKVTGVDSETASVFGEKSDSLAQSGGELGVQMALTAAGYPSWIITGLSAFGGEAENAFKQGATYEEAGLSGAISAGAEILTEQIGGSVKFGGKTLDDAVTKALARNISNKAVRTAAKLGMDVVGEGSEEVVSGFMSAVGQKITYADDKELNELFSSEDAWESFIGGAILGGGAGSVQAVVSNAKGVDYTSGLNKDETAVVEALYAKETEGKKLTAREKAKAYDTIIEKMENGTIKVEEIEEILGGDSYKTYDTEWNKLKSTDDWKALEKADSDEKMLPSLQKEYDKLYNMTGAEKSDAHRDRQAELKSQIEAIQANKSSDIFAKLAPEANRITQLRDKMRGEVITKVGESRLAESYREFERSKQKFTADTTKYTNENAKKTVQNIIDSGLGDNSNAFHAKVELLAKVSADTGVTYTLTENSKLVGTEHYKEGFTTHGFIDDNGNIVINMDSKRLLATTAGHEVGHEFQKAGLDKKYSSILRDYCITKEGLKGYNERIKAAEEAYKGRKNTTAEIEVANDLLGEYIFNDENFIKHLSTADRNVFQKVYDTIKYMCKIATAGSEEKRLLEKAKHEFEKAWREISKTKDANAGTDANGEAQYSLGEIIDENNNSYGIGVHLDSTLLDTLSPDERIEMVKEYVKELGGTPFTAYDSTGNAVDIMIAKPGAKFKNKNGRRVPATKDLTNKRIGREVKQEAIALVDELILTAEYDTSKAPQYPHGWLDKNGQNDWEYWTTYIQDKNNTIWKATLNVANSADGAKILYDISPIKKVGRSIELDTIPTDTKVAQEGENVKHEYSMSKDSEGNQLTEAQVDFFKDSVIRDENGALMPMYHGTKKGGFTVFGKKDYWYFAKDSKYADTFEGRKEDGEYHPLVQEGIEKGYYNPQKYSVYLNVTNPFITDDINIIEDALYWDHTLAGQLRDKGYDALMLEDMSQVIVLNPEQIKNIDNANPTSDKDIRYSMSKVDDQYMEAVNIDDMISAEKAVEEYANLAMPDSKIRDADGKLLPVYHGTNNMFYEFAPTKEGGKNGTAEGFGIYLSDNQEVTNLYGDRQMKMYANITKPATSSKKTITSRTLIKLIKDTCEREAQRMVVEDGYDSVREAVRDTWISNFANTYDMSIDQAYRTVASDILRSQTNDKDIIQEVMFGMAIRSYDRAMKFYQESLTPVTGIDGFITEWDNPNTGETSTIYLAFDSSQLKSADAVTRDDNGNVIPLSERFDPTKKDIRFSVSKDNNEYSPYREAPADFGYHDPLDDFAPVRDDIDSERREAFDALTDADVPPVLGVTPEKEITTVEERVQARIQNTQTELDNNRAYREQSYMDYDEEIAGLQAEYDSLKNKNTIKANNLLRRIERAKRMRGNIDADYAKRISDLEKRLEKYSSPEYKRSEQRRAKYDEYKTMWEEMLGDTSTWKDKALGLSYKTTTMRRFLRDVVRDEYGKKDFTKADAIYDELETKYDHHEAQLKRESGKLKESFFNLKLNKHEDTYAHMVGEFRHNPETTLTQEVVDDYYDKHKNSINKAKVDHAIEEARKTFDDLIVRVNEVLKEQGMKEIPYRKGYFPHFKNPKQGFLGKLLNWKKVDTEIPTSIAGLTENFNPERSWQSFNKQRKGDTTDYSLYQGLDTYIHGALDWIYHIEDIQKRRSLENYIRYIHSEEGVQARIDEIRANETYDADEAQAQIELVLDEASNPLNNLVTELRARTNTLANKKSSMDRGMEEATNRKIYSTMTNINNRVNANMVVGSFSSALTNFIPMVQSWHQVSPWYTVRGLGDFVRSAVKDDGMVARSDYLTNRLVEEEKLYKTGWDKVSDKAAFMMNVIDNITSQTVWRSKYLQNKHEGMSESQAIKDADQFAKNLMAGRSRGNQPTIFESKNPLIKICTAFQLEVANQYGFMFKDTPQDSKNAVRLVKGYATAFMGAYLYNALYSSITGRDAAFDPIGIIEDLLRDLGIGDDEEKEETKDVILNFADNVVDELPFIGSFTGGGRVPISSAMPYDGIGAAFEGIVTDASEEDYKSIAKEMLNPLYYLIMPVGGGQIKKTVEGLSMFSDDHPVAGSYTDSGALRFPVEDTFGNKVKAAMFGQWSSKNARDYIENGRKPLSEDQLQEYIDLEMPIQDYWAYRDGLKKQETLEDKFNYIDSLDVSTEQKNIMINNVVDRKEQVDMERYDEMGDYEEFDFYSKNPEKYEFLEKNGISYKDYTADEDTKEYYDNIYSWVKNNPNKVTVAKAVTNDVIQYKSYTSALDEIRADKDSKGNSISGSAKEKKKDYIFSLDLDEGQKYILFKTEYPKDDTYNYEIIDYLNSREDISYEEMNTILTELGFTILDDGVTITWD